MKEVTICAWIKTDGFQNNVESVLSYATSSSDNTLEFHFDEPAHAVFHVREPSVRFPIPRNLRKVINNYFNSNKTYT